MTPGPCVRRHVKATIVTPAGRRFIGTNFCLTPQTVCPRGDMPTGVGYELCTSVCHQPGHAEVMALSSACSADLTGAVCYVEGHDYACEDCLKRLRKALVFRVLFCPPPNSFDHSGMDSMLGSIGPR